MQSITAPVKKKCPECKKMKLKKLIGSGGALIFKGSGFYCNDYRKVEKKKPVFSNRKIKKGPAKKEDLT